MNSLTLREVHRTWLTPKEACSLAGYDPADVKFVKNCLDLGLVEIKTKPRGGNAPRLLSLANVVELSILSTMKASGTPLNTVGVSIAKVMVERLVDGVKQKRDICNEPFDPAFLVYWVMPDLRVRGRFVAPEEIGDVINGPWSGAKAEILHADYVLQRVVEAYHTHKAKSDRLHEEKRKKLKAKVKSARRDFGLLPESDADDD